MHTRAFYHHHRFLFSRAFKAVAVVVPRNITREKLQSGASRHRGCRARAGELTKNNRRSRWNTTTVDHGGWNIHFYNFRIKQQKMHHTLQVDFAPRQGHAIHMLCIHQLISFPSFYRSSNCSAKHKLEGNNWKPASFDCMAVYYIHYHIRLLPYMTL